MYVWDWPSLLLGYDVTSSSATCSYSYSPSPPVLLLRPQVQEIVRSHSRVRANGGGHSFNDFVCSPEAMIQMTEMKSKDADYGRHRL